MAELLESLRQRRTVLGPAATALLIVGLAALSRLIWTTNPDTSWLLDVAERALHGATPYRDLMEVNPPASFLIYMPAVRLAAAVGMEPETATAMLVFAGALASLAISGHVLFRAGLISATRAPWLLCWGVFVLLLLPLASFAQREHIAAIAILPVLACAAARLAGKRPGSIDLAVAGTWAGAAVSIKPVFALALLGPYLLIGLRLSCAACLKSAELWIALGLTLAYGLAVMVVYPDYGTRILPLATLVYLPARLTAGELLLEPGLWICAAVLLVSWRMGTPGRGIAGVAALASVGFTASVLIQGKGYIYHV